MRQSCVMPGYCVLGYAGARAAGAAKTNNAPLTCDVGHGAGLQPTHPLSWRQVDRLLARHIDERVPKMPAHNVYHVACGHYTEKRRVQENIERVP